MQDFVDDGIHRRGHWVDRDRPAFDVPIHKVPLVVDPILADAPAAEFDADTHEQRITGRLGHQNPRMSVRSSDLACRDHAPHAMH